MEVPGLGAQSAEQLATALEAVRHEMNNVSVALDLAGDVAAPDDKLIAPWEWRKSGKWTLSQRRHLSDC